MFDGTLHFACHLPDLSIQPFFVPGLSQNITRIHVSTNDDTLILSCKIKSKTLSIKPSIIDDCLRLCQKIRTNISFKLQSKIGEVEYRSGEIRDGNNSSIEINIKLPHLQLSGRMTTTFGTATCKSLQHFVVQYHESNSVPMTLYVKTFDINDPMSKFMILYLTMAILHGDNQANIDNFIIKIAPDTKLYDSPLSKVKQETIYTKLRNEIAHHRNGVNIQSTITQIEDVLIDFADIVRRGILESLQ